MAGRSPERMRRSSVSELAGQVTRIRDCAFEVLLVRRDALVDPVQMDDEHRERLPGIVMQALGNGAAFLFLGIDGAFGERMQFAVALLQLQEERTQGVQPCVLCRGRGFLVRSAGSPLCRRLAKPSQVAQRVERRADDPEIDQQAECNAPRCKKRDQPPVRGLLRQMPGDKRADHSPKDDDDGVADHDALEQ